MERREGRKAFVTFRSEITEMRAVCLLAAVVCASAASGGLRDDNRDIRTRAFQRGQRGENNFADDTETFEGTLQAKIVIDQEALQKSMAAATEAGSKEAATKTLAADEAAAKAAVKAAAENLEKAAEYKGQRKEKEAKAYEGIGKAETTTKNEAAAKVEAKTIAAAEVTAKTEAAAELVAKAEATTKAAGERREKEEQQAMEAQQKQNEAEQAAERATKEKEDKANAAEADHKGEQADKAENAAKQQAAADENAQKATERAAKAAESDEKTAAAERLRKDEEAAERAAKEKEDKAAIEEAELKAWERTDKSEKAGKAAAERAAKDAVIEAAAKEEARQAERAIKVSAELAAKAAAAAEKAYKQDGSEKAHKSYSEKMDKSSVMQPTPPPTPVYSGCHASGWFKPTSVAKATCTSEQRPSYDPMAMGGEPAGTCEQDESGNAAKLLAGGETFLRAASGSGKVYSFAYAFDSASWIDELHLEGRSTGAMAAHNDNRFYATFSTDGELWSDEHAIADCQDLSHGKCTLRLSKQVKMSYVKLIVRSSCTACNNADYVKSLRVKCAASGIVASALTTPTCAPVPERCTLQGVPSLRLGSDTCAWGLVQLGPQGLRFSASKCVSRRNFCGAQRDNSCGASVAPVASRLTITTTGSAKSYVNLHEDGTVDFEVPNGGCVEHIAAAPKVSKGAHFQDIKRGSDAYIMYEETGSVGLKLYTQGLDIDCTTVSGGGVSIKK